jgi:hypothetical protein
MYFFRIHVTILFFEVSPPFEGGAAIRQPADGRGG